MHENIRVPPPPLGVFHRLKSSSIFLFYELSNHSMCNQLLVLYLKLMIYDEARATVKYLNYCMCYLPHDKLPHEQKMSEKSYVPCAVVQN